MGLKTQYGVNATYPTVAQEFHYILVSSFPAETVKKMQRHGAKKLISHSIALPKLINGHNYLYDSLSPPWPQNENKDSEMFYRLIEACKLSSDIRTATETHAQIIRFGYSTYPNLTASLIATYFHCNFPTYAHKTMILLISLTNLTAANYVIDNCMRMGEYVIGRKLFDGMRERGLVTWNTVIGGYVRNARYEEALALFRLMLRSNVGPDKFTFASVIAACAKLGGVSNAKWVHELMLENGVDMNFILSSALIDMYAKCGRIRIAKEIFDGDRRDDVCVWNAMINAFAIHGLGLDAIALFSRMDSENVKPDSITFLGILMACGHCGLVEEGQKYFALMRHNRCLIHPEIKHYGAMIDLLCRAGRLEEAYAQIEAMPMTPDIIIWRSLLSACRTYKNPGLAEVAMANIKQLHSGDYILLSNMYCSQNRWESAQEVRELMMKGGVHKDKGKSWVEWAGVFYHFKSDDRSHPESEAIYKVLEGLIQLTKLEGFLSATELVTMDISEEEKEANLHHHSEKLALAFAILKSSPGSDIMISKNLRICCDCHSWMKVLSRQLSRVILVRDRIRFHQFEGGLCSCGDYW